MLSRSLKALAAALLVGSSAMAPAANDGQRTANRKLSKDPDYREAWQQVVKKEERLPGVGDETSRRPSNEQRAD